MSKKPIPRPPAKRTRPKPSTPHEKDTGFNESHGYGPTHGGPSGPGDAPSKQAATVVPIEPEDSSGEVDE